MARIQELMNELDGADPDTVNRIAWREASLPVRMAMLGLASIRKSESPLWWGYPPGVFIGYKWSGVEMRDLVLSLSAHVRELGYRAFLDVEELSDDAEATVARRITRRRRQRSNHKPNPGGPNERS